MSQATNNGCPVVKWALRVALSGVFFYAGAAKMREIREFAESIASFQLLPGALISPMAFTLPPMEIMVALLALANGRWRRAGAFCLLVLLAAFTVALVSAIARGLNVDCGCFGGDRFDALSPTRNLWVALARDLLMGTVAWFLYTDARRLSATITRT